MNLSRLVLSVIAGVTVLGASAFGQSRTIIIDAGHGGYDRGGVPNPWLSTEVRPLGLTAGERADLVELMHALSGTIDLELRRAPTRPR